MARLWRRQEASRRTSLTGRVPTTRSNAVHGRSGGIGKPRRYVPLRVFRAAKFNLQDLEDSRSLSVEWVFDRAGSLDRLDQKEIEGALSCPLGWCGRRRSSRFCVRSRGVFFAIEHRHSLSGPAQLRLTCH